MKRRGRDRRPAFGRAGATWSETTLGAASISPIQRSPRSHQARDDRPSRQRLVRSESLDRGTNWSAFQSVGVRADTVAHASAKGGVALSWTDPPPHSTRAAPGLRALRLSLSTDIGRRGIR
jgi:hypothetical protein